MKRYLLVATAAAVAVLVAALASGAAWAGGASPAASPATSGRTILIHAATAQEKFIDAAPTGFSLGDAISIRDYLTNAGGKPAGHDGVVCTVTLVASDSAQFECLATLHLTGGDLMVQGLFTEPFRVAHHPTAVMAVTGGTGIYAGAAGTVSVHEVSEEKTDYTFHLLAS
jgi:hypothetical protein